MCKKDFEVEQQFARFSSPSTCSRIDRKSSVGRKGIMSSRGERVGIWRSRENRISLYYQRYEVLELTYELARSLKRLSDAC